MIDTVNYAAVTIPWWMHIIHSLGPSFPWIIIAILIVLVAVSVFGNIGVDWKEKKFTFGHQEQEYLSTSTLQKRSCTDCIMLILGKRTIFESTYHTLLSKILRDQMIFAEHKIQEAKYFLLQTFQQDLEYFRQGGQDLIRENKEYIIYQECISNALEFAKDEVRRSFKENGFHTLEENEFKIYLKEREQNIITVIRDYLRRTYPSTGMIVPIQERFKRMEGRNLSEIGILISDVYINARVVRNKIEEEIKTLESEFVNDINTLVGDKNAIVQ